VSGSEPVSVKPGLELKIQNKEETDQEKIMKAMAKSLMFA